MGGNLLHVDFKGVLPDFSRIMMFPEFWKRCGFTGVVLEFDAKYPWKTWPGVRRGNFARGQFRELIVRCQESGLETIPLIQIHGHLEWLLDSPRYEALREAGFVSEICPLHPGVRLRMKRWIDEVAELFSGSRRIHLGGDETRRAGSCPRCKKVGKKRIYTEYFSEMSRHALKSGLTPMIWGDFFSRENAADTLGDFPDELQLIDWNYDAKCTFENTLRLLAGKHKVLGASGIGVSGCAGDLLLSPPADRFENISRWQNFAGEHDLELIHTIWGRDTSLGKPYANWYAAAAGCIAAGDPGRWAGHPWRPAMLRASAAIKENDSEALLASGEEISALPADGEIEKNFLEYCALAMRFQRVKQLFYRQRYTRRWQEKKRLRLGLDESSFRSTCRYFRTLEADLAFWERDFRRFFRKNRLSDLQEVLDDSSVLIREDMLPELALAKKFENREKK